MFSFGGVLVGFREVAMAGVAQSMMACSSSAYVRGTPTMTGSAGTVRESGKSRRVMLLRRISAVKTSEECNEEDCAPEKEVRLEVSL